VTLCFENFRQCSTGSGYPQGLEMVGKALAFQGLEKEALGKSIKEMKKVQ
jgi:hypothetical protein